MPTPTPESYETVTIKKENITVHIKFSAKLKGETDVTITPQVSGQLMRICVTEGDVVKLELESAQASLQAAIAQENSARIEYESNKNLYEKKIVSKYTFETAENSYNQAKASVAQYRAQVNRAKVNLGYCTITAPVTGSIGEIPVRTGDQVSPSTYLTTVSGNANMDAEFSLPERTLTMILSEGFSMDPSALAKYSPEVSFVMKSGTEYEHKGNKSHGCGQRFYRYHLAEGYLPQPQGPALLRYAGFCCDSSARRGCHGDSAGCCREAAGQAAGV